MVKKPPPLEPRLEKKELRKSHLGPLRTRQSSCSGSEAALINMEGDLNRGNVSSHVRVKQVLPARAAGQSRGPCKPLDLLAKRGLRLVGGDVTDASKPARCSILLKTPLFREHLLS
ncbi:unnamed protein product [Pleuronectes platessa]|uniref:Uncharacterized protein n=1 Tax=Pleuronectes platessa TaxID=8262 RepID=A0A9N7V5I2_PLEPL|nr:unnamed protein product [Pleuronectes platessa]